MRVFTVSDIHTDYRENDHWVRSLSNSDYVDDILILAGDISDSTPRVIDCFNQLKRKFKTLFYVPGNHDLWVRGASPSKADSIDKFFELLALCRDCGVVTEQRSVNRLTIRPMFSWYDLRFGEVSDELFGKWMDFFHCRWPETLATPMEQNRYFLQQNSLDEKPVDNTVITFSHFLPRIDLMPSYIPHRHREIYPVLGSPLLDRQIRTLNSKIHIYGHSHVNREVRIEGIDYINNAFGYPSETRISSKKLLQITY
ncbi:MAG: metallophosphoesterase [Candidatus Thiodiazotropha sp.]